MRVTLILVFVASCTCATKSYEYKIKEANECADYLNDQYGDPPGYLVIGCLREQHNIDLIRIAIHQAEKIYSHPTQQQITEALAVLLSGIDEIRFQEHRNPEEYIKEANRLMHEHYFGRIAH